jgi:hypothetical protein
MDLAPLRPVLNLVHVLAVMAFLLVHGASALVALKVRTERDPTRIRALLELSSSYQLWAWVALAVLFVAGILAGIAGGWWTSGQLWLWASLGVFVGVTVLMTPIPTAYLNDVRHAVGLPTYDDQRKRREPPPPASEEELVRVLRSNRPIVGAAIGLGGIAILTWLMMMKPF